MSRIADTKSTYNLRQDTLNDINNLFIAIKMSQMDASDPKVKKVQDFYPIPTVEELDKIHHQINEAFQQYERELRKY